MAVFIFTFAAIAMLLVILKLLEIATLTEAAQALHYKKCAVGGRFLEYES